MLLQKPLSQRVSLQKPANAKRLFLFRFLFSPIVCTVPILYDSTVGMFWMHWMDLGLGSSLSRGTVAPVVRTVPKKRKRHICFEQYGFFPFWLNPYIDRTHTNTHTHTRLCKN